MPYFFFIYKYLRSKYKFFSLDLESFLTVSNQYDVNYYEEKMVGNVS